MKENCTEIAVWEVVNGIKKIAFKRVVQTQSKESKEETPKKRCKSVQDEVITVEEDRSLSAIPAPTPVLLRNLAPVNLASRIHPVVHSIHPGKR